MIQRENKHPMQLSNNFSGQRTLASQGSQMNDHYSSQPVLFKTYNDLVQQRNFQNSLPNSLSQINSVLGNNKIRSFESSLQQNSGTKIPTSNSQLIQEQLIYPKHLDTRKVINDLRNQRKTLHSILSTTSEREILGLKNNGTIGSTSMNGAANNENISQLTFNQMAHQNHQQYLDSNIFHDQMLAETVDQSPMQQYLKIGNGSAKRDYNRINQFVSSMSNSSNKRLSILKQGNLQKQANMFRTQESNEELPLLTGFIQESQQVIPPMNNGLNRDKRQSREEQQSKSRHRSVLQTSDPLQLQLLREVLDRNESPEPAQLPNNKSKNQIQFTNLLNDGLHRTQQLQAVGGMLLKHQPDLFFNGRNSQQQNVLLQHNNPLVQSMKSGVSSQASFINNPRVAHKLKPLFDGSRFNTDTDTDFEGYMSAAGGGGRAPSLIQKNYQMGRLQQQDSISSNNVLRHPISQSMHQLKNSPTLASAASLQQHHVNQVSQQQQQMMDIDKRQLLQQIDELIQKKKIASELQILEGSKFSQPLMQAYDHENQLYNNQQTSSDYQSQIGSSYPLYFLEQNHLNSHLDTQSVYLPKTYSRNHFQGGVASASLQQLQRGANLYQTEIYQPNYMNMHPQILLEDEGSNQHDENFALYQQQANQEQLLRNAEKNRKYLTLQNLPQHIINKQDDMRTHKVHQILGSTSHKHRRQSLINEEISEREEIALEFAQEEKEETPPATRYSKFKPDQQNGKRRDARKITNHHIIDDMTISPIETELRPSLIDPKSAPQKGVHARNISQNQEPSTQLDSRYTSTIGEGNVGMTTNLLIKGQNQGEDHINNNNRRNTVDSTSTDDRDIRLLKEQIKEGLKRSAEHKMASLQQIKIPIFDDQISTDKNKINGGVQNQTSNSRIESSHIPITVVITQDQDIDFLNQKNINKQSQQQVFSKQQIKEEMKSSLGQQDKIDFDTQNQGGSQETPDIIHNTSPAIFKNQQIRNSPLPAAVNQLHNKQEEIKERKQVQPKNSNSSTLLSLPHNPLLQFKDSGHRASDIGSAKTYIMILNENEAKELNDIDKLLKKVDGEESTQNKKLHFGGPVAAKNKLPPNNQAKRLSKKSSIKNPKDENQSYESFSEKFNSSRRASLHNNIIAKSRENDKQSPQATPVVTQHLIPARDSIKIDMSLNSKLLETVSDATPLQKSPIQKSEARTNNDSPEIIHSLLNRGSISIVSNVMSLDIVREDPIARKPSEHSNRNGSSQIKIEEEQKKSSVQMEITRMPYGMAKKVKESEETEQNRRKSIVEDSRTRNNITTKSQVENNEIIQDRNQQSKLSNQQITNHEEFQIPSTKNHLNQQKTLILLKNNVNLPDSHPQFSENIPLPVPQPVTTITMLAPTIDAILDPIVQEIVQNNNTPPPHEKIFKRGRNARGKSMFAQNILFKLTKPRKQLDPEEVERMLLEKEKEDKDFELEELKVQSQTIPKPPTGKRRYVDYLIKQNETSRPESTLEKVAPQVEQSIQKQAPQQIPQVSSNQMKTTKFASQFSFREKEALAFRKQQETNINLLDPSQEIRKETDFNIKFEPVTNPNTIKQTQINHAFQLDQDKKDFDQKLNTDIIKVSDIKCTTHQQQQQQQPQLKHQTAVIVTSSLKRGITNNASPFLKQQQIVKFLNPDHSEISIPQEIMQNIDQDVKRSDSNMAFTTLAIAKVPEVRQTYGARPKMSEVRLAITPYVPTSRTISPPIGPDQDEMKATSVPRSRLSDIQLSNIVSHPQKRKSEMKLSTFGPIPRESNSNLGQLGSADKTSPNRRETSKNILAPPEFKHSKIDVQIIQTTLEKPSSIYKEKQLRKMSSNNIQHINFNKIMKDPTDPLQLGNDNLESDLKSRNNQSLGTLNQGVTSERTAKESSKQLIMPRSHSSTNFLLTQQSLFKEPHLKQHPEGPTLPKKSNKVLPIVSTKSISSLGRFMRGAPNRKVSSNGEFTVGGMHGKNF